MHIEARPLMQQPTKMAHLFISNNNNNTEKQIDSISINSLNKQHPGIRAADISNLWYYDQIIITNNTTGTEARSCRAGI